MAVLQGSAKSVADGGFYPTEIAQSLRFNDDDTAYLSRTPSSTGNRKTWTWSGWVKLSNITSGGTLFQGGTGTTDATYARIWISNNNNLVISYWSNFWLITSQVFRDPSAWYHIVVQFDTTQATTSDRIKMYVNGERVTAFSTETYPAQNSDHPINSALTHNLGVSYSGATPTQYLDGYLADVHFVDGTAYTADAFGEFKSGVWVAKTPSVTYGTNGFYLDFADSGNIGNDANGSNNWTPTNLAATDVMLDSPTNNFATLNPLAKLRGTLSEGNLKTFLLDGDSAVSVSTFELKSVDKLYAEAILVSTTASDYYVGIIGDAASTNRVLYNGGTGQKNINGTVSTYGSSWTVGDVIGISYNNTAEEVTFYKNGVSQGAISFSITSEDAFICVYDGTSAGANSTFVVNFGQDSSFAGTKTPQGNTDDNGIGDFYYAPPTGYLALCTANLPEPSISPLNDASPSDYFNTVLYTGNSSTQSITGIGFQPDLVWGKLRTTSSYHRLHDVIRGSDNTLASNVTDAEVSGNGIVSFDADGFTMDSGTNINQTYPYVAWNWKANGTGVSNTDGTITSTVSANVDSGFSIVSYTGNGSAGATVGHGLSSAPEMLIFKWRNQAGADWQVFHSELNGGTNPFNYSLYLNQTAAQFAYTGLNNTAPSDSVITLGSNGGTNGSSGLLICYAFHSVEGFSKIGSYTGNGSADGPFVYTGFRPSLVLCKRTDSAASWFIFDDKRDTYNEQYKTLLPNSSAAEDASTADEHDFLSNGFKWRSTGGGVNASGGTYIYMAFAENPFKYSTAR